MKNLFFILVIVVTASSCLKKNDTDHTPSPEPPFEKFKYFWTEIEKKEGSTDWVKISNGNVLRLFTNDSTGVLRGQYDYNPANSKIAIPNSSLFAMKADSILFYKQSAVDPNKPDIMAKLEYELLNDKLMVIRNKSVSPSIEIKFSKQ